MADDYAKWMKGPLPPLSESIISSGLVTESNLSKQNNNNMNSNNMQQHVFGTVPLSTPKKAKKPSKPTIIDAKQSKKTEKKTTTTTTQLPPPDVSNYKTPTVEQIYERNRAKSTLSKPPMIGEPKKLSLRKDIIQISNSLDHAISEITPLIHDDLTISDHAELMDKLIQLYNFHFNQLILSEKDNNSDFALLLRRFQQFYNQIISDIPAIKTKYEEQINAMQNQIEVLSGEIDKKENYKELIESRNIDLEKSVDVLKDKIEEITKKSHEKDIKLQNIQDENEFNKSSVYQLNFQIKSMNEEMERLKKAIQQRDDEMQRSLLQNEEYMKDLTKLHEGEAGYIALYHEEKVKRENAESKIKELQKHIHEMSIQKSDISVDTSDIPQPILVKTKSKKKLANEKYSSNSLNSFTQDEQFLADPSLKAYDIAETQTSPRLIKSINETIESQVPCNANSLIIEKKDILSQTYESIFHENKNDEIKLPSSKQTMLNKEADSVADREYIEMPSQETLKAIPDLLPTITPYLSKPCINTQGGKESLNILLPGTTLPRNDKPLIWGLQLIHNFLTDSYLRSIVNITKVSTEIIFVDWVKEQYKIQHLVNQVINDFSYLLINFADDPLIKLFTDILENTYSFPQVCFISTIYSFSVHLTKPSYLEMLQGVEPKTSQLKIHIRIAFELLTKSFNDKIANTFLLKSATKENPYIDYISFLRQCSSLFGDKHLLVQEQARNLLKICRCSDLGNVQIDSFKSFFCFLGINNSKDLKHYWKSIQEDNSTTAQKIISLCADKKKPLMKLISLKSIESTVKKVSALSALMSTFFEEFVSKFTDTIPAVLQQSSDLVKEKTKENLESFKDSIINVDIQKMLWEYNQFLLKFEDYSLNEKGFIPFSSHPDEEVVSQILEYFQRAESVSFAFVNS